MIIKPLGFNVYGTNLVADRDQFTGFRIIRRRSADGIAYLDALSTIRWGDETYPAALVKRNTATTGANVTEPNYQTGTPANGSVLPIAWALIGVEEYDTLTPHYWNGNFNWFSDSAFFEVFYNLPERYRIGWNNGTRMDATELLQNNGLWFWRPDNTPPLTIECKLNYEFQQKECWDGGTIVNDLSGNGASGIMRAGALASSPGWGQLPYTTLQPWCGTWPAEGTYKVDVVSNVGITNNLTIEYIGKFTGTTTNNTGAIVSWSGVSFQNYNGSSTWGFSNLFGATNGTPTVNNHIVLTLRGNANSYSCYAMNNASGGLTRQTIAAGTAAQAGLVATLANVGSGVSVGYGGSNTEWDGEMNCFRMWDGPVSDQEARILQNHSQGVVSFGSIL